MALEDTLGCLVIPVPALVIVTKDEGHALEVHFPSTVEPSFVKVSE
jgi:hypothetical protein